MLTGLHQKVRGKAIPVRSGNTWTITPPADRQNLTRSLYVGRNLVSPNSHPSGRGAVRQTDENAGKGGWKKRKPDCNRADRGSIFALTGNRADFHLVFNCETSAKVSLDDMYENYI